MSIVYTALAFAEILALFASFIALMVFVTRATIRAFLEPKEPPPKPEDLRHLKRAGQSGFY
jgi:energy-converting hydrogenase Eha subunit E